MFVYKVQVEHEYRPLETSIPSIIVVRHSQSFTLTGLRTSPTITGYGGGSSPLQSLLSTWINTAAHVNM